MLVIIPKWMLSTQIQMDFWARVGIFNSYMIAQLDDYAQAEFEFGQEFLI